MILQLASTTPYLSGQQKLDILLRRENNVLKCSSINVTPLSPKVTYNEYDKRDCLRYKHSENIKNLYKQTHDTFFSCLSTYSSNNILYSEITKDTYDHTYELGTRRARNERYNRQFESLCPMWVETTDDLASLEFELVIVGEDSPVPTSRQRFTLSNAIENYLIEYYTDSSDFLMNIDFENNLSYIKGLNVENGTTLTKDCSYLIDNLLEMERTALETDSLIANVFANNKMIAKQLLNLNFCFSIDDIVPKNLIRYYLEKRWNVYIDIYKNGTKVELKDLYSNYSRIPSYKITETGGEFFDRNALEYMNDNNCIDLIYSNKMTKPVVHWSLLDNNDYIFNVYNGMSPIVQYTENGVNTYNRQQGRFYGQADPFSMNYSLECNNLNWCKIKDLRDVGTVWLSKVEEFEEKDYTLFSPEPGTVQWVNYNKYDFTSFDDDIENVFVNIVLLNNTQFTALQTSVEPNFSANVAEYVSFEGRVSFLVNAESLASMSEIVLYNMIKKDEFDVKSYPSNSTATAIYDLHNIMKNYIVPVKIIFNKSLKGIHADSPDIRSKEIDMYKDVVNVNTFLYRYSGNIRPSFISIDDTYRKNYSYRLKQFSQEERFDDWVKKYNNYLNTGFKANFPSLGYYALEGGETEYSNNEFFMDFQGDYTCYKDGLVIFLKESITASRVYQSNAEIDDDTIYSFLYEELGFEAIIFNNYIRDKYKFKIEYDYISKDNVNFIRYDVMFYLK